MLHPQSARSGTARIKVAVAVAGVGLLTACATSGSSDASAESFPDQAINVIVPFTAGGGTDISMRALAEEARKTCGTSMTITNVDGGAGAVGMQQAANAPADGYTIAVATSSTYLAPTLGMSETDPSQFTGIMQYDNDPAVISVPADSDIKDFDDLAEQAESELNISTSGAGSITQLAFMGMAERAGMPEPTNVPLGGGSEAILAALGGKVDAVSATAGESYQQIKSGKLRPLVVMSDERLEQLPDVPTLQELKVDWSIPIWRGLVVPADVPDDVVAELNSCFREAYDSDAFQSWMKDQSFTPTYRSSDEFSAFLKDEYDNYDTLVDELGLQEG